MKIRERITAGESDTVIAKDYPISRSLVHCIRTRKSWGWL